MQHNSCFTKTMVTTKKINKRRRITTDEHDAVTTDYSDHLKRLLEDEHA